MDNLSRIEREVEVVEPLLQEENSEQADETTFQSEHISAVSNCSNFPAGSISNLCSATLGAGALSLPYAISSCGIIFGVFFLLISAYLTIVSINIIIDACVATQSFKFEDVAKKLVGSSMSTALEASLLIFCFGTAVAYICAIGDILDQSFHSITYLWEPGSTFASLYSRERVMVLFWTTLLLPLSLQSKLKRLEKFSSLGVLSIIFLVIAAVIHSIIHGDVIGDGASSQEEKAHLDLGSLLWPKSFVSMIQALPIIIFAFSCQVNVCQIFEELKAPSSNVRYTSVLELKQQTMKHVTRNGIMLCTTLYLFIGIFGFLDFTKSTSDDILVNYCIQVTHDALMTAATFCVFVAIVVAFPFNILPARVTLKLVFDRLRTNRLCRKAIHCPRLELGRRMDGDTTNSQNTSVSLAIDAESHAQMNETNEPLLSDDIPVHRNQSIFEHVMITLLLSGGALIMAILVPGISIVFGLMGGTAASIISFILPGMLVQKMKEQNNKTSQLGRALVWGGFVVGVLTTLTTLYGALYNENNTSGTKACE